ncbi:MAG: hypothetical protein JRJ12_13570 [Deltaproteobacteria bacterium]|nr:hypothetical protein [Deltaproteobacteria bacterium]MBW2070794.1 hypothetical protein [Deltaproteobacteria bacterium]
MARGKPFECEITVSPGVEEKLLRKHNIEMWEVEEVIYDDKHALSISYGDCYFVYGQTFSGRCLLVLVRILSAKEVFQLGLEPKIKVLKVITARDMNARQRRAYSQRKGRRKGL